jgi:hypothetical protein
MIIDHDQTGPAAPISRPWRFPFDPRQCGLALSGDDFALLQMQAQWTFLDQTPDQPRRVGGVLAVDIVLRRRLKPERQELRSA